MTFKKYDEPQENQKKEAMSKELYEMFIDLLQLEVNKLTYITAAKAYFCKNGLENYKEFFEHLYKMCAKAKGCISRFVIEKKENISELNIPEINLDFEDVITPFKALAKMEDDFEDKINKMITQAFDDRDWASLSYLLKKLDSIDHLCCRALAAVENKSDVLKLIPKCEQHISEK